MVMDETAWRLSVGAGIDSVAPTVLSLMGLPKPSAMEGPSLLVAPVKVGGAAG
jgi:2,3-bisphosphoglycerate-independent phosphoglycerate mutase